MLKRIKAFKAFMVVGGGVVKCETDSRDFALKEAAIEALTAKGVKVFERERSGRNIARREIWPDRTSWCLE